MLFLRFIVLMFISCGHLSAHELTPATSHAFFESFLNHYEVSPEGRYTHEYHPFLLQWTSESLDSLEKTIRDHGVACDKRMVIMGYEENAVQQYYPNFKRSKIDDEATHKNNAGWSQRLRNRFGFMSGFLLKDVEIIKKNWTHKTPCIFEHIDFEYVPIFADRAAIFHEHAFGTALPLIYQTHARLCSKVRQGKTKEVLADLAQFWHTLYAEAFTVGNKELAGTQDVLFSIAYAQYLMRSSAELKKFFIGPDITYPIEVTTKQDRYATVHAQHFVQQFIPNLVPENGEATAYIFCSFVDGVGKSTMLGNIKNWMKHGNVIEEYGHVDNSSSQLADMFKFDDNVYIVDLPAQMSHFTYKPDGYVFVDMRTYLDISLQQELDEYVTKNKVTLREGAKRIEQEALMAYDASNFLHVFIKNVYLLSKQDTQYWVPFEYQGKPYLFNDRGPLEIRSLTTLSLVKSEGLKNIESEQMLFTQGIRFPLHFTNFCDDLVAKLKSKNIKHAVFVDFLSMYPRSQRENIRINYVMQQMALFNPAFAPYKSLYKDFVSGGELLYLLQKPDQHAYLAEMLHLETMVRYALFKRLIEGHQEDIDGQSLEVLTDYVCSVYKEIYDKYGDFITGLVRKKLAKETDYLEKKYGLSKAYMNVQHFSPAPVAAFCQILRTLFTHDITHEILSDVWKDTGVLGGATLASEGERLNTVMTTDQGHKLNAYWVVHESCKNAVVLAPVLRSLRACWYGQILNLLSSHIEGDKIALDALIVPGIPIMFDRGLDGHYYVTQPSAEPWTGNVFSHMRAPFRKFHLSSFKPSNYVVVRELLYRSDWESKTTSKGLMGFDSPGVSQNNEQQNTFMLSSMAHVVQQYQQERSQSAVLPTQMALEHLHRGHCWEEELRDLRATAIYNGNYLGPWQKPKEKKSDASNENRKLRWCSPHLLETMRLIIRLLATLEMVLKDPDSDVVIRYGNREDFKAGLKILESVVFPNHCNVFFLEPLFDDYDMAEPYPSWEWWDKMG